MSAKSEVIRICVGFSMLLLFAGVFTIFYFSWLPDPVLSKYDLLPNWLAQWTDASENDTLRTAVPFVCLGFVVGCYLSITPKNWRWWLSSWIGLTLIVLIAETGQLVLPHRNFDWADIAWGIAGSLCGLFLVGLGSFAIKIIKIRLAKAFIK